MRQHYKDLRIIGRDDFLLPVLVSSHYLNQCWNLNQNTIRFIHQNASENLQNISHWSRCNVLMEWVLYISLFIQPGGRLTKTYDVTIPRYRKSQRKITVGKMHILRCMGSKFCVKFQRAPLKFHTRFWTHSPQNMHFTRCSKFDELWYLTVMTS